MALAQRIKESPPPSATGMPCSIGGLLTSLPKGEAVALNAMLYELGWNATQVYDALRDEGHTVGRQSINRHRGEKCRCFKGKP